MSQTSANSNPNSSHANFVWTTDKLATATQGQWQTDAVLTSQCICTDTRKIKAGDVFLAIVGDNFDGHDYIEQAQKSGAIAVIVSKIQTTPNNIGIPQLLVKDTKLALGDLGRFVRQQQQLKVFAITGSSGKTTTKEMLGSILNHIAPTLITRGNLNNDLGVPMMLLELQKQHQYAVLELGANHIGEIGYTTQMVKPDVACILNIGTAHMGEFGGRDAICQAKAEIFHGLSAQSVAVIPTQDDYTSQITHHAQQHTQHMIGFGADFMTDFDAGVDGNTQVFAKNIVCQPDSSDFMLCHQTASSNIQEVHIQLPFSGRHNISNALAAAACALGLGVSLTDIAQGLMSAKTPKGRLNRLLKDPHILIDDTYNSNPSSVLAAADVLAQYKIDGIHNQPSIKTMMVLGDIGELGDDAINQHQQLGQALATKTLTDQPATLSMTSESVASDLAIDCLYAVGDLMTHCIDAAHDTNTAQLTQHFNDKASLVAQLKQELTQDQPWVILFKASRYMTLETVIHDIL